jgi:GT2 family glycosyltransferase
MNNNISVLVGLKNNLDYSKYFYQTTRALYPDTELVFTSYNSTDGTNEWLDSLEDDNVKYFHSPQNKTLADTYNKCTELATKDFVVFAHNDMVLGPDFIEELENHISQKTLIYYTTIEPPIYADDNRPWKIVKDWGTDIVSFKKDQLYTFAKQLQAENGKQVNDVEGVSFFLCIHRQTLLSIGGLDPLYNPMFCEDDDLILRLNLLGLKKIIVPRAVCYHFVSKTSRFAAEYLNKTQIIELNSNRNFVRKWGFKISSPIKKKYDIGFIIKNCNEKLLSQLEPFCSNIYIDCNADSYIAAQQPHTLFNLSNKIKPLSADKTNGILISFNGKRLNKKALQKLERINEIITDKVNRPQNFLSKFWGWDKNFKSGILRVQIANFVSYENKLIKLAKK